MSLLPDQSNRIGRRALFERIWSKPMTTNAAELGTSTWVLSALAKRLGLPLPRAGHWQKKDVGKEPPTPDFPADPELDEMLHVIAAPKPRYTAPPRLSEAVAIPDVGEGAAPADHGTPSGEPVPRVQADAVPAEHKKVASTRTAIRKPRTSDRVGVGGRGKFRLLVTPATGDRACAILDRLLAAVEARGWSIDAAEPGYAIVAEDETVGFMIEEKLDRVPHVVTAAELKEKAEYDRECALADRGIGYRPWRAPAIPEHDHVPNGELVLKFDHDYAAGGTRRTFSDGKRQRLEDLVPAMIESLERWAAAVKARREELAQWKRESEERERRRRDHERQIRVEGYRIAFLQRQIERQREIDGLTSLIAAWEKVENVDPKFVELLEFARLYRTWLEARIAPAAITERIAELKLMDDDVYIYDEKRLD